MLNFDQMNLRRWGALASVLVLSLVLAACGDDDDSNNGQLGNNGGVTDTGDAGQTDGGQDAGDDGGPDADGDATSDAGDTSDTSDTDEDTSVAAIEIAGEYDNGYGAVETITSDDWTVVHPDYGTTAYVVVSYDNDANHTITQNSDDGTDQAEKFNKVVWTEPADDGSFYNCMVAYGEDTAEAAANTDATADESDLEGEGCGGFSWTKLTPVQ